MNSIVRKFVIENGEVDKILELFNIIKISDEHVTNLRNGKCIIQFLDSEILVSADNIKLLVSETNDNNGNDNSVKDTNESDKDDLDEIDDLLNIEDTISTISKYPEIVTTSFADIVEVLRTVKPVSDILITETNSEYIYEFKINSGSKDLVIRYNDFKTTIIDEYRAVIEEFETKIEKLGEKLDSVTIENFSDIQKLLKKSKQGIYLIVDPETNKIVKLIGNITIVLNNDDKYADIDDEELRPLEIALPKYINIKSLTIELYKVSSEDNDVYIIKYIPDDIGKLTEYGVNIHIFERPKDLEADKSIF